MDLKKIEKLMEIMREHGATELELEDKGQKTKISFAATQVAAPVAVQHTAAPRLDAPAATESTAAPAASTNHKQIRSPFVGTFYESPSPGSAPFVKVGQRIKKGDVLCIIEAMKLMNEIEADTDGEIVEILVNNEEPVEFDRPLFLLK